MKKKGLEERKLQWNVKFRHSKMWPLNCREKVMLGSRWKEDFMQEFWLITILLLVKAPNKEWKSVVFSGSWITRAGHESALVLLPLWFNQNVLNKLPHSFLDIDSPVWFYRGNAGLQTAAVAKGKPRLGRHGNSEKAILKSWQQWIQIHIVDEGRVFFYFPVSSEGIWMSLTLIAKSVFPL